MERASLPNDRLKRDFERIKKHRTEKAEIGASERGIFKKLKDDGFNPKALRFLLTLEKMKDRQQFDDDTDTYRVALGLAADAVRSGEMSLREAGREFGVSKSAIHREISVPQVSQPSAEVSPPPTNKALGPLRVAPDTWAFVVTARDAADAEAAADLARIAAEKEAEKQRRIAERERLAAENRRIDADDLSFPPFLRRSAA